MKRVLLAASAALIASALASPAPASAAASAVGNQSVYWVAVSPAFERTGFALAQTGNSSGAQLWATHNGGHSWSRIPATGWSGSRFSITVDGSGHEVVYAGGLQRSTDGGGTWTTVATGGAFATPSVAYASDGTVAVAGKSDFLSTPSGQRGVTGSGGAFSDISFTYTSAFTAGGANAPILLSAADKNSGLPLVATCDKAFACSGAATLPGSVVLSAPASLYPSNDFAHDGTVFAQSGRGIYKSVDGGRSFVALNIGQPGATATATPMFALAGDYTAGGDQTAYAAVLQVFQDKAQPQNSHSSGGVYRTTDGGVTWNQLGSGTPLTDGTSAVALAPDGRLFAGFVSSQAGAGLLCSTDGVSWVASCPAIVPASAQESGSGSSTCAQPCGASSAHAAATGAAAPVSGAAPGSQHGGSPGVVATPAHTAAASVASVPVIGGLAALLILAIAAIGVGVRRRGAPARAASGGAIGTVTDTREGAQTEVE